jgi:hypothetical protein
VTFSFVIFSFRTTRKIFFHNSHDGQNISQLYPVKFVQLKISFTVLLEVRKARVYDT